MATLKDYRDERLRKLAELKELGVNPYPAQSSRTHNAGDIAPQFDSLEGQTATVAGRIVSIRKFGKLAFIVLRDFSGQVQLFLRDGEVLPLDAERGVLGIKELPLLDTGDFVEATGLIIKTQTGEISIGVQQLRLLTKSLRPMPSQQEGFTNKEERMRRRYVDMNVNRDVRDRFVRRSKFWQATRRFLENEGFIEVNNTVLEATPGGADANPFITYMDALDQDFYLRISHELPLKRLLVAGFEKVFDLGARFRNENYTEEHLPEHNAMEWYWAYADWEQGMELTERMIRYICDQTWGTRQFTLMNGQQVDFGADNEHFPRISFVNILQEQYGIDVFESPMSDIQAKLKEHGLEVEAVDNRNRSLDKLWKKYRKTLAGPVFLIDMPVFMQPLAKVNHKDERLTEQFNLVFGGSEMCKAFSELNDPVDQLDRFAEQQAMRDAGDDEAQMLDIDYVEALEYGMPPACGLGYSERIFWSLEGITAREGVPFPQLRNEIDETTKSIYPNVSFEIPKVSKTRTDSPKDLPLSAIEEGTYKLYLEDYALLECESVVQKVEQLDEDTYRLVLDKSCVYPGGGGQAFDLGTISWNDGSLVLTEVSKDAQGIIYHDGTLTGNAPAANSPVHCSVDAERRLLNSRLHCVGHLIDYAVKQAGKNWKPGRGAHFPEMSFVEYEGEFAAEEAQELAQRLETGLQAVAAQGGAIGAKQVPSSEARAYSDYIPEVVLKKYQNVQLATYPNEFYICCGGTHLTNVSQIGAVEITKIKRKDGNIRVSYRLGD